MATVFKRFEGVVQLLTYRAYASALQDFDYRFPLLKRLQPIPINGFIHLEGGMERLCHFNEALGFPNGSVTRTIHRVDDTPAARSEPPIVPGPEFGGGTSLNGPGGS
jgi:hypothetical protein